jgi:signal transduction histidine kinase
LLRSLGRAVTYTRWLHLCIPLAIVAIWLFIDRDEPYLLAVLILPFGFIPAMRSAEGLQALFLLTPDERGRADASIATAPAVTWTDRWRTVAWLELRLLLAGAALVLTIWLPMLTVDLIMLAGGGRAANFLRLVEPHWWFGLLVPVAICIVLVGIVGLGELVTFLARLLLSPSPAERLAALEARNEQLLERTRIARELHDAIGHALTITVMQAGAARAADDPVFTEQALSAIEDTGRAALEDLDRALLILRESSGQASGRPTLTELDRLLESARTSGATITTDVQGSLEQIPVAVSQEGYRILQEALTNALRHGGAAPVHVRIAVDGGQLELAVTNSLIEPMPRPNPGTGLRGIRERAASIGGQAQTGPTGTDWTVAAQLPMRLTVR